MADGRIAVLLTGAPRTILHCIPSIKSLFDPKYTIDYFTWIWNDDIPHDMVALLEQEFPNLMIAPPMDVDYIVDMVEHLKPNSYDVRTIYSKSWANFYANALRVEHERTHGVSYDAVAFMRTDVVYNITGFDPLPYFGQDPKRVIQSNRENHQGMWSDQFMVCQDQSATHFANMILWMEALVPRFPPETYPVSGELNTQTWMESFGNYHRVVLDIPHKIVRFGDVGKPFSDIPQESPRDYGRWL